MVPLLKTAETVATHSTDIMLAEDTKWGDICILFLFVEKCYKRLSQLRMWGFYLLQMQMHARMQVNV